MIVKLLWYSPWWVLALFNRITGLAIVQRLNGTRYFVPGRRVAWNKSPMFKRWYECEHKCTTEFISDAEYDFREMQRLFRAAWQESEQQREADR